MGGNVVPYQKPDVFTLYDFIEIADIRGASTPNDPNDDSVVIHVNSTRFPC